MAKINKNGMAVLVIVIGMLIFSALGLGLVAMITDNISANTDQLQAAQTFYVAEGGLQYILMNQFNGDVNFSDNISPTDPPFGASSIALGPGQFWIEYSNQQPTSINIKVTAKIGNAVRTVQVTGGGGGSGYQYVTLGGGNLSITNSTGNVYGDAAVSGSATIGPNVTVHGNIVSNVNNLDQPTIDFQTYRNMTTTSYSGTHTFSANTIGNIYVSGNVTINANVTFTGVLYAGGNVALNGSNIHINGTLVSEGNISGSNLTGLQFISQPVPPTQMPAILTNGNLSLQNDDNMQINGIVWTDDNLNFSNSDNFNYHGSFMTGGNTTIDHVTGLTLTFDSGVMASIPGLQGGGTGQQTGSLTLSKWKSY